MKFKVVAEKSHGIRTELEAENELALRQFFAAAVTENIQGLAGFRLVSVEALKVP